MKFLGREPALWALLIATSVRMFSAFIIEVSPDNQARINAVATALGGLFVAWMVRRGLIPAILGAVQALLALGVGFGFEIDSETQAVIMSFVGAVAAMFIRTQVIAPVPPEADPTD